MEKLDIDDNLSEEDLKKLNSKICPLIKDACQRTRCMWYCLNRCALYLMAVQDLKV